MNRGPKRGVRPAKPSRRPFIGIKTKGEVSMEFVLGNQLRDRVTGFEGIALAYVEYMTGCNQYLLKPEVDDEGKMREGEWVDESILEFVRSGLAPATAPAEHPGGPMGADTPPTR